MKKLIAILIAMMLILTMTACGGQDVSSEEEEPVTTEDYEEVEESADAEEDADSAFVSDEFKKTMDDYEAWFDHYCEVMKRYQEDPSDLELLSEMSELISEEATMLDEMENMDQSEMNTAELAYYLEVTARIEKNLLEVADY